MKKISYSFLLFVIGLFLASCHQPSPQSDSPKSLADYFKEIANADTMVFEINQEEEDGRWTDTIPNSLLFTQMETRLMNGVAYFDNSADLIVIGRTRFPLTENREAYLVEMRQSWYRHLSLFIFDKNKQTFIERETVAEFYGGDGGQILAGSWLTDYDGDKDKDIIRREIEHWLITEDEGPRDTTTERATLLLWKDGGFRSEKADSAKLVSQFPITSWW